MAETRTIPTPFVTPTTKPYWDAASDGRLVVKFCTDCGRAHFYPRDMCPHCGSVKTEWRDATGRGTVYSYTVMRRVPEPYALAYVTLEEGVTLLTNIVDCDLDAIKVGGSVKAVFKASADGPKVPMFTLA